MDNKNKSIRVSLLATPETDTSSLTGMYGIFTMFQTMVPGPLAFETEIVMPQSLLMKTELSGTVLNNILGVTMPIHRTLDQIEQTDIFIIPAMWISPDQWELRRYPELTDWILTMHRQDTLICSACTGAMFLAETGLLDGYTATQHWAFERIFRQNFPKVNLEIDKVLLTTGKGDRIVMSGASAAWHDLVMYLIARYADPVAAQTIAKFFLLHWHADGQAPYIIFQEYRGHSDAIVLAAQDWLRDNSAESKPVEKVIAHSGLPERTFNRRFRKATGHSPINYIQHLRIEAAKKKIETTDLPIDDISYLVGYEEPTFFRRLFKRLTGMTPKAYRRKFQINIVKAAM